MYLFIFAAGAVAGSFVNACIYRIPRGMSVLAGRSMCPSCKKNLSAAELIPIVSYVLQKGRCKSCGARISPRYPIVEALCGLMWAALLCKFLPSFTFACYAALFSILLAVAFIDYDYMRIPNRLALCASVPALSLFARHALFTSRLDMLRGIYGSANPLYPLLGLLPAFFFFLIYIVTFLVSRKTSSIGMGDIKLLIPVGVSLGIRGALAAVFTAVTLGAIAGVFLIIIKKKKRKDPIPFGPFIVVGSFAALFI